jgi:hypothetical protein
MDFLKTIQVYHSSNSGSRSLTQISNSYQSSSLGIFEAEGGYLRRTIGTVLNAAADIHWLLYDKVDRKKKYIASAGTTINSDPTVLVALTVLDICFSRKYMTVNVVFISSCFLEYSFSAAQT